MKRVQERPQSLASTGSAQEPQKSPEDSVFEEILGIDQTLESVLGKRRTNNNDANANDNNNNKTQKLSNILQDGISKAKASGHVNIGQRVERETLELDDKTIQQQLDHANALRKIELKLFKK